MPNAALCSEVPINLSSIHPVHFEASVLLMALPWHVFSSINSVLWDKQVVYAPRWCLQVSQWPWSANLPGRGFAWCRWWYDVGYRFVAEQDLVLWVLLYYPRLWIQHSPIQLHSLKALNILKHPSKTAPDHRTLCCGSQQDPCCDWLGPLTLGMFSEELVQPHCVPNVLGWTRCTKCSAESVAWSSYFGV